MPSWLMAAAGLPTAGGEVRMPDIAMEAARSGNGRAAACLCVVEELLAEEGDGSHVVQYELAVGVPMA
ncbi:hypothetical protein CS0771_64280 [Catellatospora sp. IY07-71]|uniref:hypothetical protein n=1 Tax=Catellatospora sp. IY07-71 TaxID=2728827 RepID=UPI001BB3DB9E|nr:hypothetical protein [Catellatospora sp. IY07-71]BCJ76884.1 hypothetical protein CS0771_64280 [Catellatospora sp. IY07-71]